MPKKKSIKTQVDLQGAALDLVISEQKRYEKKGLIRGKNVLINMLLSELAKNKERSIAL